MHFNVTLCIILPVFSVTRNGMTDISIETKDIVMASVPTVHGFRVSLCFNKAMRPSLGMGGRQRGCREKNCDRVVIEYIV